MVDVTREFTAIHEANLKNIPVIALVDTNCNPVNVDYPIPSNDDAIRAIKLLVGKIADAVLEGKAMRKDDMQEEEDKTPAAQASQTTPRFTKEEELSDEELLGASTLAKLQPEETEETAEEAPAVEEAVEAPAAEEAPAVDAADEEVPEVEEADEASADETEEEPEEEDDEE